MIFELFSNSEIGESGIAIIEKEDVFRFEIAIDDVFIVKILDAEDNSSKKERNSLLAFLLIKNSFLSMKIVLVSQ